MEQLQRERLVEMAADDGIERLVVAAVIADADDRVLLRRAGTDTYPGLWELPSGGVDSGESLADAWSKTKVAFGRTGRYDPPSVE